MYEDDFDDFDLFDEGDDFELFDEEAFNEMEAYMEGALLAESDEEADAFLGALLSTAAGALPSVISVGSQMLPQFLGAAKNVLNSVARDPNVRRAARTGANVIAGTVQDVAKRYASGGPVSGQYVARRAAANAANALPYAVYGTRRKPKPKPTQPGRRRRPRPAPASRRVCPR
jgi:hypothetical protein